MSVKDISSKLAGAILLFIITLFVTLLPNIFKKCTEKHLKKLSSFSGGLFLGLCFLDLIPDVLDSFIKTKVLSDVQRIFPIAEFIICFGLIIFVSIEKVANYYQMKQANNLFVEYTDALANNENEKKLLLDNKNGTKISYSSNSSYHHITQQNSPFDCDSGTIFADDQIISSLQNSQQHETVYTQDSIAYAQDSIDYTQDRVCSLQINKLIKNKNSSHLNIVESKSKLRIFFLILAFSVHSLFEGLMLGLQSSLYNFIQLIAILAIHKCLMGFFVGVKIVSTHEGLKLHFKQAFTFAIATPIGIIIGLVIVNSLTNDTNNVISAVLIALSTGTFVYVTFFEILGKDINSNKDDFSLIVFFFFGFLLFSGIKAIPKPNI
ncbi:zinc transporter ZIP1 isoform X3 [Hydra vulgaris]|uniref:Zinc transporter ZIP1 isoform X3 n=1 Tax=Hydra vulgaris TaxID=6087 RepID=A0ABM4B5Z6_HYDVU